MRGHRGNIYSLSFSRESTVLVSGGSDCTVRAWDVFKTNYNNPVSSSLTGSVVTPSLLKHPHLMKSIGLQGMRKCNGIDIFTNLLKQSGSNGSSLYEANPYI